VSQGEKKLLNKIESLRKELNNKINDEKKYPEINSQTLNLSRELDELINQYMHAQK